MFTPFLSLNTIKYSLPTLGTWTLCLLFAPDFYYETSSAYSMFRFGFFFLRHYHSDLLDFTWLASCCYKLYAKPFLFPVELKQMLCEAFLSRYCHLQDNLLNWVFISLVFHHLSYFLFYFGKPVRAKYAGLFCSVKHACLFYLLII